MHSCNCSSVYSTSFRCVKRTFAIIIILIILSFIFLPSSLADDEESIDIGQTIELIDFSEVDDLLSEGFFVENITIKEMIADIIKSNYSMDVIFENINIISFVDELFSKGLNLVIMIIFLLICCALVNSIGPKDISSNIADSIAVIFCIIISAAIIRECSKAAIMLYSDVERLSSVLVPVLCTILTMMGGVGSAGLTQAMLILLNESLINVLSTVVMPLIAGIAVMAMIAPLTQKTYLTTLSDTIGIFIKWGIGFVITISTAVFSFRGLSVATTDGVMLKTAEYAIDDLIPVVGGAISDITGIMIGGVVMVKNAFGVVAVSAILLRCIMPVMIILMYIVVYKLSGIAAEFFNNDKLSTLCNSMSKIIMIYLVSCISIIVMVLVIIISSVIATNKILTIL